MKYRERMCIVKRFHGQNDGENLIKNSCFNEVMHATTENYEKNSKNVQKSACILERDVVI